MTTAQAASYYQDRNEALLQWYAAAHRDFPWRHTDDAYSILVAEVMLQQTQADRVVAFYTRFLGEFATVEALAAAELGAVLEVWSGLGYNTRAKRVRDAARDIVSHGWPDSVAGLELLPGVGPYTAAAVGSFAFGMSVPAVDTNVRRVLSRWHGEPLRGAMLARVAAADLANSNAAAWNQAMMELGATRCAPTTPECGRCPVAGWCTGPEVYLAPRPQRRFEGSGRQLRGAIIRCLVSGPATWAELVTDTKFDRGSVEEAIADLESEGLVTSTAGGFRLSD